MKVYLTQNSSVQQHYIPQQLCQNLAATSLWLCQPVFLLLQLFENNKMLLPALDATAQVEPTDGDGFCVLHSMLSSQGHPNDDHYIEACLEHAKVKCQQFLSDLDEVGSTSCSHTQQTGMHKTQNICMAAVSCAEIVHGSSLQLAKFDPQQLAKQLRATTDLTESLALPP